MGVLISAHGSLKHQNLNPGQIQPLTHGIFLFILLLLLLLLLLFVMILTPALHCDVWYVNFKM